MYDNLSIDDLYRLMRRDMLIVDKLSEDELFTIRCYHVASAVRNILCLCIKCAGGSYSNVTSVQGLYNHYLAYCKMSIDHLGTFCHVLDHWLSVAPNALSLGSGAEDAFELAQLILDDLIYHAKSEGYLSKFL